MKTRIGGLTHRALLAGAATFLLAVPLAAVAGEGGTSHILPGSNATLMDLSPTTPGWFVKPIYLNYSGSATANIPTAAGVVANANATANTFAFGGGYTFDTTVLGGAHYTVAAFLPYTSLNITANGLGPNGNPLPIKIHSSVSGFGDLTIVPVMLGWKSGDWQFDALMPVYIPTGSYVDGRLGNPGLNYWTYDPMFGVAYSNKKSGFNAVLRTGYAMSTENSATHYQSGSLLHFDGSVEQILPVGSGFLALGAEAFYFDQVTGDSGSGAVLGNFKGMTNGIGPVLGYIKPLGKNSLVFEGKWLTELNTKNRLEGDYWFLRAAYKF
jgi:hypothetical protein